MIAATDIRLFDAGDAPWIASLLDLVERSVGEPWRVLLERIEHTHLRVHPSRVTTMVGALRRVTGSRAEHRRIARKARALTLGHPALDRDTRDARIAAAACVLGLVPSELESVLWADLAKERPVTLPTGRPRETTLAAFANLDRIQRAVRRAREVRICVWDEAHQLVRMVARYGLLASIGAGEDGETILDVTGPLAVFHATTVYGRALAALVPLLANYERFTLDVHCDFEGQLQSLHVERSLESEALLLPEPPVERRRAPSVAEYLARELVDDGWVVEREPPAIGATRDGGATGNRLLFPDLAITREGTPTWWIEVVGFSTAEYIDHKLAAYRAAGIENILLCVDAIRQPETSVARREDHDGRGVIPFVRRVDPAAIEQAVQRAIAAR